MRRIPICQFIVRIVVYLVLAFHFGLIARYLIIRDSGFPIFTDFFSRYFQMFYQGWSMFSPPPEYHQRAYVQFLIFRNNQIDTSQCYNLNGIADKAYFGGNHAATRFSFFVTQCMEECNPAYDNLINEPEGQQSIPLKHPDISEGFGRSPENLIVALNATYGFQYLQQFISIFYQKNFHTEADSVLAVVKSAELKFPDFGNRHKNFYDPVNYKIKIRTYPTFRVMEIEKQ